jgi:hypothetical protein
MLAYNGSRPIQKTFCWRNAQGLGRPIIAFQIAHFQGANAHPMYHGVK